MYNRDKGQETNQEILQLLKKMNEKLDHIQGSGGRKTEREAQDQDGSKATSLKQEDHGGDKNEQNTMWNLTQIQYELSNELFDGLTKLKRVIHEGEKHANRAKGKYQK